MPRRPMLARLTIGLLVASLAAMPALADPPEGKGKGKGKGKSYTGDAPPTASNGVSAGISAGGISVSITVLNPSTGLRSAPFSFVP